MHRIINIAFVVSLFSINTYADSSSIPKKFGAFNTLSSDAGLKRECIATKNFWIEDEDTCSITNEWSVQPSLRNAIAISKPDFKPEIRYHETDDSTRFDVVFYGENNVNVLRKDILKWAVLNFGKPNHQNTHKNLEINAWNFFKKDQSLPIGSVVVFVDAQANMVKISITHGLM